MLRLFVLTIAGAAGTLTRYLLGGWLAEQSGSRFPYETLIINLSGCFAIGFLGTLADEKFLLSPLLRTALLIGFLGAFTTYSTFAYETWNLVKDGEFFRAGLNALGTFIFCFLGLIGGVIAARLL